ncbi:MAG TPA: MMPL family transporter, partial [Pontiella sp.]|nr:MMPL family transporter [Pontiella sp.]
MNTHLQRALILAATLLVGGISAWFCAGLQIEQDNHSMQSSEAREDPVYEIFQQEFDSRYELMVVVTRDNLTTDSGRQQLAAEAQWLAKLDGVRAMYLPGPHQESSNLSSADRRTAAALLVLDSSQARDARSRLLERLRSEAPNRFEGEVEVVGLPLLKNSVAKHIARDQRIVTPLSGTAMMVILGLLFRRISGVVLPMIIVGLSLVTTLGLYAASGFELNSITSLLPPVVIVLSVSVSVHLFDAWLHAVDAGEHGESAIRTAVRAVWKPCVFTAAMTAVGLLSLTMSPIPAVRLFGFFAATGVSLSVIYAFAVLPIALRRTPERPHGSGCTFITRFLNG